LNVIDSATISSGDHVRAPSVTGDTKFVVLGRDKGWLIVAREKDGTVMPPLSPDDVEVV